ncbi:MAG: T9SS type A sorting domain-containing protein, partial [Bacteroidia bacterium]|nr:T9SS type A sorting domain-containing protein [Bacteroidia bacterium]
VSARAGVVVTVDALPSLSVSGTSTICAGDATTLTATGADTYVWIAGPATDVNTVSPSATATYTVIGTNTTTTCFDSTEQIVTVNTLPVITISGINAICAGGSALLTASGADTYQWTAGPATDVNTVSPSSSASYTVVGTNSVTGCSNTTSQFVTVNSNPVVSVTNSLLTGIECEGSADTLIASGANTYLWSTSESTDTIIVTHATGTITWSVIGTDLNGCTDTVFTGITSVSALLPVTLDFQSIDTACVNFNSVTLGGETPAGGTWSGTSVSGTNFDPSVAGAGTHYITYTVLNTDLCASSATDSIYVDVCMGLNAGQNNTQPGVFPNPNNGTFTIRSANEGVYNLVNELGQSIRTIKLNASNNYTFTFEGVSNGVYYLVGTSNEQVVKQKIVVTK